MKKIFLFVLLIMAIAAFAVGLMIIFNSTTYGEDAGINFLESMGGAGDTESYLNVIASAGEKYRIAGMVISLIGGAGLLLCLVGIYKGINPKAKIKVCNSQDKSTQTQSDGLE